MTDLRPDQARLVLEKPQPTPSGGIQFGASLIESDGTAQRLWWEVPDEFADAVTPSADPWVIGFIFAIMQRDRPVHIEGVVSPSLLNNLESFMSIWQAWTQGRYRCVALSADREAELPPLPEAGKTLVSFSCGVDSCFTAYRHSQGLVGRRSRTIHAGLIQHGFDVWLDQTESQHVYDLLHADAKAMLGSLGLPCISLKTNFHELNVYWHDAWGSQLVSGLALLSRRYDTALLANDMPYVSIGEIPWAHHPLTTPLLSSKGFAVIDDGGESTRSDKIRLISRWREAMQHLRVCFGVNVPGTHDNCCRCEKCARTVLAFRVAGCPVPASFRHDITDEQIGKMRLNPTTKVRWQQLSAGADEANLGHTGWAKALRAALRRHRRREIRDAFYRPFVPIRNQIRLWARGSTLSRSEQLAAEAKAQVRQAHQARFSKRS